jgi:anti-sigma regulatory factor (Ser/Thr protein kinase)
VLSRRNVAEMFGNVGRRVSNLTTRQLAFIDAVERAETDPALLERLYSIDHIAVRLRRNADSLMLLAGIRETVLAAGPTPVSNVVRAALGQIEGYQRVRLYAGTDAMIEPDIIGDLTLMVAELLENAVSFSPAGSPVEVTVRSSDEGAHIVVTDHGLGMSAERLAEENQRLIRRERLDLVPTKVLGLFVVGALARRWEIRVELTRTPGGGVTAEVTLPSRLLLTMSAVADTSGTPLATAPAVPAPAPAAPAAPAAAAETGPTAAVTVPASVEPESPLPRRLPRREPAAETEHESGTAAPLIPAARSGEPPADSADGTRPLRRRVRGATLRTTVGAAQSLSQAPRTRDADAERDALEEFEAAVERARRDSDTGSHERPRPRIDTLNPPQDQNHLPEGAEQ